jgi:hypothetical protein
VEKCSICYNESRANGLCGSCYGKQWYIDNKAKVKRRKDKAYLENKEKEIARVKKWRKTNPDIVKRMDANRDKVKDAQYYKNRYNTDINYRLKVIIRNRLHTALKDNFKKGKTLELLGCSIDEFKIHIESQWIDGMNWDNHLQFGWHIDHIIPLASFDLTDPEQLKKACHYTNMQPMWWLENIIKKDKI